MPRNRFSIVIPTRNEAAYIGETLAQFEEYLDQYELEIIVSDANSTDGTDRIVRNLADSLNTDRIRLIQSNKDEKQNIAMGRNLGASIASGAILIHMDADVRLPDVPEFFERIQSRFETPKVVAATGPLWVYPEEVRLIDRLYHLLMNATIRASFPFGLYLAKGECQIVRQSVFEKIGGYNERIVAGEDCNLFYRLHKQGKVAYMHRLKIYHSPRRFREYGYFRLTLIYLREGFSLLFFRKSYSEEWRPVR